MLTAITDIRARAIVHNGALNVLDYAMQPLLMLAAAPLLLRRWGLAQYGVWMLISAVITAGTNLYAGIGDATVKYVASYRGRGDNNGIARVLRATMFIHLIIGGFFAVVLWLSAPTLANLIRLSKELTPAIVLSLRIAAPILILRSGECVLLASLRGLERYAPAVALSVTTRTAITISVVATAILGHGIPAAITATLTFSALGIVAECAIVRKIVGPITATQLVTRRDLSEVAAFASFGGFQGLSGVFFNQADRWAIGVILGTSAVAYYSICVQIAQPVHGLVAAGFNAMFPHLSARLSTAPAHQTRRTLARAFNVNVCLGLLGAALAALAGRLILPVVLGSQSAQHSWPCLLILVVAFALLAGNISGHFTLLALGDARYVSLVNVAAAASTFVLLLILAPRFGLPGAASARLIYGPITWLVYARTRRCLQRLPEAHNSRATLAFSPRPGSISRIDEVTP
jgi:O-antigen/teichoic acid export membrane protein